MSQQHIEPQTDDLSTSSSQEKRDRDSLEQKSSEAEARTADQAVTTNVEIDHGGPEPSDAHTEKPISDGPQAESTPQEDIEKPDCPPDDRLDIPRKTLYTKSVGWLLEHQGSPHAVALGFAIGVFVAFTPTVGFQMVIGATIAHFLKANRVIAAALAWITNPITVAPIYYFNYRVGLFFVGGDVGQGKEFIDSITHISIWRFDSFMSTMSDMLHHFAGIAGVLWLGSMIVGAIGAAISYPLVRRIVSIERAKLEALKEKRERCKKAKKQRWHHHGHGSTNQ
ncbi:MAG: DUF2062 domain-containing protein [Deltaproteobacteria bacterium]|nr:DUF2062 domain-containing protein [Deltaproteobacteria bacterium]